MITKTTVTAIRALVFVAQNVDAGNLPPRRIAEALHESPTYMAKVTRTLVKAGILRSAKGVKGGLRLGRPPKKITFLHVYEACQGTIVDDYCRADCEPDTICSFHGAASELHESILAVLSRWTLARFLKKLEGDSGRKGVPCLMKGVSLGFRPLAAPSTNG